MVYLCPTPDAFPLDTQVLLFYTVFYRKGVVITNTEKTWEAIERARIRVREVIYGFFLEKASRCERDD